MNEARLQELEAQITQQQALLVERQEAVRQQQERVAALMRELELLRECLADAAPSDACDDEQVSLPF
jgi:uncharacterized coiled-coil protein SlyX